jgi:hypothetical protein
MRMVRQMRKPTFSAVLHSLMRPAPALIGLGMSLVALTLSAHVALAAGTVGNGTPGSCSGDLLASKMAGGGLVTFNCGGPATLSISNTQTIATDTAIDGTNNGSPITLTAPNDTQLFHVNSGVHFTLTNLTVADVNYFNGPIYNFGGHIVVSGSTFLNNASGAILNEFNGSTIVAVGSLFSNTVGPAIGNYAGTAVITDSQFISNANAIYGLNNAVVRVVDSYFSHNHAIYGGGIKMSGASTVLTVTGSTFYSNTAFYGGSAIYADSGTTNVSNTVFTGNTTGNTGNGVVGLNWGASAGIQILSSKFLSNTGGAVGANGGTAIPLVIADTSFIDNDGGINAGAINAGTFSTSLVHDTFIGNHTTSNFAGALNAGGPVSITNSVFLRNTGLLAGALFMDNAGVPAFVDTLANSLVEENRAVSYGGGIDVGPGAPLLVSYVNVLSNTVTSVGGNGAGLYFGSSGNPLTVTHSLFFNNVTTNSNTFGGGLYIWGNALIVDSTIVSNTAGTGGGVYMELGGGALSLVNDTIAGNSAFQTGGNVFNAGLPDSINALNTILAGGTPKNCGGPTWLSLGHNLSSDASCPLTGTADLSDTAPLLGALRNNGGPTWTLLPTLASPAIDAGANAGCPADDQRGLPHPHNGVCDIGAVEYQGSVSRTFVPITMR